jgi:uncharacterized protein
MFQTFFFIAFFFWRCSGMMLLGMALLKLGFLDGRRSIRDYSITALACIPFGLALAGVGMSHLEAIGFAMPQRTMEDSWNYRRSQRQPMLREAPRGRPPLAEGSTA